MYFDPITWGIWFLGFVVWIIWIIVPIREFMAIVRERRQKAKSTV